MSKKQYKEKNISFKKNLKSVLFSILVFSFITCTFVSYFTTLSTVQNNNDDNKYNGHLVYGHALPTTYNPEPNSIINKNHTIPSKITISFSERPDPKVSSIEVLNSHNQRVDNNDFKITGQQNNREAIVTLDKNKLSDGVYTVSWLTMSLDDGHIAKGSYVFGIGNIAGSSAPSPSGSVPLTNNNQFSQQNQIKTEAVTSDIDGLIKWPLIIAQAAIVGCIISHLFLWNNNKFINKILLSKNKEKPSKINANNERSSENFTQINNPSKNYDNNDEKLIDKSRFKPLKVFLILLCASSFSIFFCGTALIFLQVSDLVTTNSNYLSLFGSLLVGPVGSVWIIRSAVSAVVIISSILYYFLEKRKIKRKLYNSYSENQKITVTDNINTKIKRNSSIFFIYTALVAGAIGIFANSITSHNSAVTFMPNLAISLDWLHFMAVSVWLGGLFYISTVLLTFAKNHIIVDSIKIKRKSKDDLSNSSELFKKDTATSITSSNINNNNNDDGNKDFSSKTKSDYFLALLLPKFSLLATISLGIIGVSGLYMAWIHLHSFNSLFDTAYGNILIIKLLTILPVVLLGGYHQLTLHNFVVSIASIVKKKGYQEKISKEKEQMSAISKERSKSSIFISNNNNNTKIKNNGLNRFFGFKNNSYFKNKKYNKDNQNKILEEHYFHNVFSRFSKTIKIEALLGIVVLFFASILTITSPPAASMNTNMPSSSSSTTTMMMMGPGMNQNMANQNQQHEIHNNINTSSQQLQNNSFTKEEKIMDTNTKIQINPFYTGFNTFKVTFTGTDGKPAQNISNVILQFTNDAADIGPIVVPLNKISEGVFSIFGGYLSQQGNWTIQLTAQRINAYDLNSEFDINVRQQQQPSTSNNSNKLQINTTQSSSSSSSSSSLTANTDATMSDNNMMTMNQPEAPPSFDSFAILAIILSVLVIFGSAYSFKKSKQQLKETIAMFEKQDKD